MQPGEASVYGSYIVRGKAVGHDMVKEKSGLPCIFETAFPPWRLLHAARGPHAESNFSSLHPIA